MTAKCANPACNTPFRYLRGGKLFLVDLPALAQELVNPGAMTNAAHVSEFFWLCEQCCQSMRIVVEKSGDVVLLTASDRQPILCRKLVISESRNNEARPQSSVA